jgi:glycosyltransferase involved in cell wall biosynthesis
LGLHPDAKVVCSFGFIDATKHSKSLMQAWAQSHLSSTEHAQLVFVGQNEGGDYGQSFLHTIAQSGRQERVLITGFVDDATYADYLWAADVAVQLRTTSRGETSATALDCLAAGLPTIVNAHGAMAELPNDVVWSLKDEFSLEDLSLALEVLTTDEARRTALSQSAVVFIARHHSPDHCASQYQMALENIYQSSHATSAEMASAICNLMPADISDKKTLQWAEALSLNFPGKLPLKRLFLDITATRETARHTGIERVACALTRQLLQQPPAGFRVEPVYLSFNGGRWHVRYAKQFTSQLLQLSACTLFDDVVEPQAGDVYVALDLASAPFVQASLAGVFDHWQQRGVSTHAAVYDLLPVNLPEVFPPGADKVHTEWLHAISKLDSALCISKSVKSDLAAWQAAHPSPTPARRKSRLHAFELGADSLPQVTANDKAQNLSDLLGHALTGTTFLSVGTLEPRKNFAQTLQAFEILWAQNIDVNWVLVGREGWQGLPDAQRQDIASLLAHIQTHPEHHQRFFWLNDADDAQLSQLYAHTDCLLNPSLGEGLGLPLIEAAHHGLPLLLRDLPVFKEVAGDNATYFSAHTAEDLAAAIEQWRQKPSTPKHTSQHLRSVTWADSTAQILSHLGLVA